MIAAALSLITVLITFMHYRQAVARDLSNYLETVNEIERGFLEKIPAYHDFSTPQGEQKLRVHLLPAHLEVARASGIAPLDHGDEIQPLLDSGALSRVPSGSERPYYFYNVREPNRVLTPNALCGLVMIAGRFQNAIRLKKALPAVKIALSSLTRPSGYQKRLRERNMNATTVSSHSYGISFDIFFDDYYVVLPPPPCSNGISEAILPSLRTKLGFLLGDALREQFHTVLAETLMELQDEGVLYAILERRQRCYHVTILPGFDCSGK